jgi:hypothetical protein
VRIGERIWWLTLLVLPVLASATPMTMDEFKQLCGDGRDASNGCVLYVRGIIDGIFERTSQEAWKCKCPDPPGAEEIKNQLKTNPGDTVFLMSHPLDVYGACVSGEDRQTLLEPSNVARAIIARYEEANQRSTPNNLLHLNSPSRFFVWVLIDEAEASCKKIGGP